MNRSRVPPPESGISMELDIIALVSIGLHPASNRPRRADHDARAVELGLRLKSYMQGIRKNRHCAIIWVWD